jgi:DNA-binding NarL/FixJ family response regulator
VTVRVVVCEDQALVRAGLVSMLRTDPDITVVGEAGHGLATVDVVMSTRPDVALVDVRMPGIDGLEATARIVRSTPETRVIVLTTFGHDDYVYEALRAGASGFLLKDTQAEDLLSAVHAVAAGEARLDPAVMAGVVAHFRGHVTRADSSARLEVLTDREREVLQLMARGMSNAEIAQHLVVAAGTVKTHVASLLTKLGVRDRVQAVIVALGSDLDPAPE